MKKQSDDWLVVVLGDIHACGTTAAMVPWKGKDGEYHPLSKAQKWILKKRDEFFEVIQKERVGKKVALFLGGDMIQGTNKKECQYVGTVLEQVENCLLWLEPFTNISNRIEAVTGTEFHTGDNGDSDHYIAHRLGAKIENYRRLEIGGRVIDWTHHTRMGTYDTLCETSGMLTEASKMEYRCFKNGEALPHLILSHHVHRSRVVVADNGITVAVAPCWQLPTRLDFNKSPRHAYHDIGGLLYFTKENRLQKVCWTPSMPPVEGRKNA